MDEEKKLTPFDYVKSINNTKKYIFDDGEGYNAFIVNKQLSYFHDTVLYANDVNLSYELTDEQKYDYLFHSIRKRDRFKSWRKDSNKKTLENIMEYYRCSSKVAKQYIRTLTADELENINNIMAQRQ